MNLVLSYNLDIFCLVETKLTDNKVPLENCAPKGYLTFHVARKDRYTTGAGGVGVIIRNIFHSVKEISFETEIKSFELLALEVVPYINKKPFIIICIYRPPQYRLSLFLTEFEGLLNRFVNDPTRSTPVVILGDFNVQMNKDREPSTIKLTSLLNDYAMENRINVPTFKKSKNTLDLIIDSYIEPRVHDIVVKNRVSFSDHALLSFSLGAMTTLPRKTKKNIQQQQFGRDAKDQFKTMMVKAPGSDDSDSSLTLTQTFKTKLVDAFGKSFVEVSRVINTIPRNEWYNSECKKAKIAFRKAERDYDNHPTDENERNLKRFRNASVRAVGKAKTEYFNKGFSVANPREVYRLYNRLTGKIVLPILPDKACTNPLEFNDEYAVFLIDKVSKHRQGMKQVNSAVRDVCNCNSTLDEFTQLNSDSYERIMKKVKVTNCILDPIDFRKVDLNVLKPWFMSIVNKIFSTGIFPESEKQSIIYPKIKDRTGDHNDMKKYRPISNPPFIGKVAETGMYDDLRDHLSRNNILPSNQSAYRANFSTETVITKLHSDLIISRESGKSIMMVSIDLSSAFDTVDHDILLDDLAKCNVRNKAHDTIASWLKDRTFRVQTTGDALSSPYPVHWGVPQGSVLGPLLFIFYTRTLSTVLEEIGVNFQMYADDTLIYFDFQDVDWAKSKLDEIFKVIESWMLSKKLKLNISKTALLIISPKLIRQTIKDLFGSYRYDSNVITPQTELKYLGVVFDEELNFVTQIDRIVKKTNFALFTMKCIKRYVPRRQLITFMHCFVFSTLDYCNTIYLMLPKYQLGRLQKVINKAARIIFGLKSREPITAYLKRLHWLTIGPRIDFKNILIAWKAEETSEPPYIKAAITPGTRMSHSRCRYFEPRLPGGLSASRRSFEISIPRLLNKLPVSVKDSSSIDQLKKNLKTFLFTEGFDYKLHSILEYKPSNDIYTYNV